MGRKSLAQNEKIAFDEVLKPWDKFQWEIHHLNKIHISQHTGLNTQGVKVNLPSFCDTSVNAHASILCLWIISNDMIFIFLMWETRVAVVKELTLY